MTKIDTSSVGERIAAEIARDDKARREGTGEYAGLHPSEYPPRDYKDSNPKTAAGQPKPAMEFVPPVALLHLAEAMRHGAGKYGAFNWRQIGVSETTYYSAIHRHLGAWFDGQECDPESGCHHLAHVMACCAILFDAESLDKLKGDRPSRGAFEMVLAGFTEVRKQRQAVEARKGEIPTKDELLLRAHVAARYGVSRDKVDVQFGVDMSESKYEPEVSYRTNLDGTVTRVERPEPARTVPRYMVD